MSPHRCARCGAPVLAMVELAEFAKHTRLALERMRLALPSRTDGRRANALQRPRLLLTGLGAAGAGVAGEPEAREHTASNWS
jgi:hypothetical protein